MQFFGRPEWLNVKHVYQLQDAWFKTVAMDPTRMYDAVDKGEVDLIVAYSSDGRIPRYELEILTDTREACPGTTPSCWYLTAAPTSPGWSPASHNWSARSLSKTCRTPIAMSTWKRDRSRSRR